MSGSVIIILWSAFAQCFEGAAKAAVDGGDGEADGSRNLLQGPAAVVAEFDDGDHLRIEAGDLFGEPFEAILPRRVIVALRNHLIVAGRDCFTYSSPPLASQSIQRGAVNHQFHPRPPLGLGFHGSNVTQNSEHGVLYDVQTKGFVATGGAAGLSVEPVEILSIECFNRIFITGRHRRRKLVDGIAHVASLLGLGGGSCSSLKFH